MMALLLFLYWVVIPVLAVLLAWWLWRVSATRIAKGLVAVMSGVGFVGLFWFLVGGEQWRLDQQVRELCAKDGGVKVYETVRLPAEKFDQWGNVQIPPKNRAKPEDEYFVEWVVQYITNGDPSLWRSHHRLIRRSDQKLMGESVMYARSGGDLPGPWHGSTFKCPDPTQGSGLELSVFSREK